MGGLTLLFYVVGIFFSIVGIMYILGRKCYHLSADDAEKQVKSLLVTGFGLWKQNEIEPTISDVLVRKCYTILQKNFGISEDICNCQPCNDRGFFAIRFDIVTVYAEETFNLALTELKKCIINYFIPFYGMPVVYVFYEEHDENEFYFFVCYACTEPCKKNLSSFIQNRQKIARKNAINRQKPVLDDALEDELKKLK